MRLSSVFRQQVGDNGDLITRRLNPIRTIDRATLDALAIEVADALESRDSFTSAAIVGQSPRQSPRCLSTAVARRHRALAER